MTAENQARAALDAKNEAYTRMKQQLDHERLLIQAELDQTVPELQTAIQSLSRINKLHITEMKSFTSPPDLVRLVMQAVRAFEITLFCHRPRCRSASCSVSVPRRPGKTRFLFYAT